MKPSGLVPLAAALALAACQPADAVPPKEVDPAPAPTVAPPPAQAPAAEIAPPAAEPASSRVVSPRARPAPPDPKLEPLPPAPKREPAVPPADPHAGHDMSDMPGAEPSPN